MTEWETDIRRGLSLGVGVFVFIVLVDTGLIVLATSRPFGFGTYLIALAVLVSFGLLIVIGFLSYSLATSRYLLDRNALIIQWGPMEQTIPTHAIERVFTGEEFDAEVHLQGGVWPGHWVGYGEIEGLGQALFYATLSPQEQIYLVTPGLVYGISPRNAEEFLQSLHRRMQMGPTQVMEQTSRRPAVLEWPIWRDDLGLMFLGGSFLILLALVGFLSYQFPFLPLLIPLHFDAAGVADQFRPRSTLFIIPLIGLLALLLNSVLGFLAYRRDRMASYLLWAAAILVQILVWAATISILVRI
jgi:hypothetical protein